MKETNADLIRKEAKEIGAYHTNKWWQDYLSGKYNRLITVSQIAAVLGRYRDRATADQEGIHYVCRQFINACKNDVLLAKKILAQYESIGAV